MYTNIQDRTDEIIARVFTVAVHPLKSGSWLTVATYCTAGVHDDCSICEPAHFSNLVGRT